MCNLIISITIVTAIVCLVNAQTAENGCSEDHNEVNWKLIGDESLRPVDNVEQHYLSTESIELKGGELRDRLKFILFAIPRENNDSICPFNLTGDEDLRRHTCVWDIPSGTSSFRVNYRYIFTGCYYVVIRNAKGEYWVVGPAFYRTSYRHYDSKLKVIRLKVTPEKSKRSKEVITELEVPLPCIQVVARLYELEGFSDSAQDDFIMSEMMNEKFREKQKCVITNNGNNLSDSYCVESNLTTKLALEVKVNEASGGKWTAVTKWKNLLRGGNTYYLKFETMLSSCEEMNRTVHLYGELHAWKPVGNDTWCNLGYVDRSNDQSPGYAATVKWNPIVFAVAGLLVAAVLAYWMRKCYILVSDKIRNQNPPSDRPQTIVTKDNEESNIILLMYLEGSPSFMRTISFLRNCLEQTCKCRVHDLYAASEWNMINKLGAIGWVERLLRDGSKVVWVDTPQFRSRCNDEQSEYITDDFREEAIPYAVYLATNLFQNSTTQYHRHFVVRVESFEVEDHLNDPLLTISPHARYSIPEQTSLLCDHLIGPLERLENMIIEA